jgi:hypothetical protein
VPSLKVNFFELETPEIVTTLPTLSADAASAMSTYSGLPAWLTVRSTLATFAALKVRMPVRATRPVCSVVDDTATVALPLPDEGFVFTQLGFAILFYVFKVI